MHPDLIAYAAGSLDESARAQFERLLRDDADLQRQLALVRRRLVMLHDEPPSPPADLVVNTLAFVAEHACKTAPETTIARVAHGRPWWRRVDLVVAASIVVTIVGLSLPAILRLRVGSMQEQCKNNLRQMWNSLDAYQTQRSALPDVATAPRPAAGMVMPMLRDAGVLPPSLVAGCPGAADGGACVNLGVNDLAKLPGHEFDQVAAQLLPGYAYSLGFRDQTGRLHGPASHLPDVPSARLPLLADAPLLPVGLTGNSPNHSGRGQNVLFTDGHVDFKTLRAAGLPDDDIYLNQANKVAAGLGTHDVVLGNGGATP